MDSWGFASDESLSTGKVKVPFSFGNNTGLFPNEVNIEHQVFVEMGLRNTLFNPVMAATQNAFSEENKSSSKLESNYTESGLFNLNKIIDHREAQILNSSKIAHSLSPSKVSTPSKRPRIGGFSSSTPFCQVRGCNENLSSSKDYHRRHKVCEVHSKTPKVIVNGIEQRFCQQCSRFHLLGEFDDGKRSCRKRLAGHNERRRKPHVGVVSGRYERLLPSYNIRVEGNEFKRSTGAISSFPLPNAFHSPHQHKHKTNQWSQMNLEDQTRHNLQSVSSITDEQLHSLSMASSSESALSLLSYQSQNTSSNSSRIHISNLHSHPLLHDMSPVLDSEGSLVNFGVDGMFQGSKHINSEGNLVNFGVDGIFRGSKESKHMNSNRVFSDEGQTIDLIQLSSQLERVEHKKRTNGVYVGLILLKEDKKESALHGINVENPFLGSQSASFVRGTSSGTVKEVCVHL